ncbi:Clp protease N-terminal domain-containing protein [Micromonospora soli]
MFERFTDRARRVMLLAQEEARSHRHDYIDTEHLLLGLIREGAGVGVTVLRNLVSSVEEIRGRTDAIIGFGHTAPIGHIRLAPLAIRCLELSFHNALQLNHNYIGTEHLLLGLTSEGNGVAAKVLYWSGITQDVARDEVVRTLARMTADG